MIGARTIVAFEQGAGFFAGETLRVVQVADYFSVRAIPSFVEAIGRGKEGEKDHVPCQTAP
jgi:hypothetical protein